MNALAKRLAFVEVVMRHRPYLSASGNGTIRFTFHQGEWFLDIKTQRSVKRHRFGVGRLLHKPDAPCILASFDNRLHQFAAGTSRLYRRVDRDRSYAANGVELGQKV